MHDHPHEPEWRQDGGPACESEAGPAAFVPAKSETLWSSPLEKPPSRLNPPPVPAPPSVLTQPLAETWRESKNEEEEKSQHQKSGRELEEGAALCPPAPLLLDALHFMFGQNVTNLHPDAELNTETTNTLLETWTYEAQLHRRGNKDRLVLVGRRAGNQVRFITNGHDLLFETVFATVRSKGGPGAAATNTLSMEQRRILAAVPASPFDISVEALEAKLHKVDQTVIDIIRAGRGVAKGPTSSRMYHVEVAMELGPYTSETAERVRVQIEKHLAGQNGRLRESDKWYEDCVRYYQQVRCDPKYRRGKYEETYVKVYFKNGFLRVEVVYENPRPASPIYSPYDLTTELRLLRDDAEPRLREIERYVQAPTPLQTTEEELIEALIKLGLAPKRLKKDAAWRELVRQTCESGVYDKAAIPDRDLWVSDEILRDKLAHNDFGIFVRRPRPGSKSQVRSFFVLREDYRTRINNYKPNQTEGEDDE